MPLPHRFRCRPPRGPSRALPALLLAALLAAPPPAPAQGADLDAIQEMVAQGRFQEALKALEPLIREAPDNAEARFLRGVVLAQQGDVERAIRVFTSLTERFPDLSEPYNNLAVLHASRGNYERAREALTRAVELQPDYHTAHENLGDVYTKLAALAYQRAYHLRGSNRRAREKFDVLSSLLADDRPAPRGPAPEPAPAAATPPAPEAPPEPPAPAAPPKAPATPKAPAPAAAAAASDPTPGEAAPGRCPRVGPVDEDQQARVAAWLRERGLEPRPVTREVRRLAFYQVYLPGGGSRESARALMETLSAKGVEDLGYIGSGDLAGDISLGLYSQEASVERRRARLADLGYEPRVLERYRNRKETWLALPAEADLSPATLADAFPELQLEPGACR